jgi:cation transport regulator ChaC
MLQKYNEKKDKLGSQRHNLHSATVGDAPPKPTLFGRLSSQRGNSGERSQPQYIAYLEKTLDKSEQTSQQLRQVNGKLSVLESKVEGMQVGYNLDYVVQKIKGLEEAHIHQAEENNLNKILV